jgi:hypothetical protein
MCAGMNAIRFGLGAFWLFAATQPAQARSVTTDCEGKIGFHPLRAYTAVIKNYGTMEVKDECIFVTRSRIGRKILKVCPKGSQCSIEADIENSSNEYEIYRIISINRIGTPALDAAAARDKAARDKSRWAAVNPYKEKAQDCAVKNLGEEVTEFTINDLLLDGICSQVGMALRREFIKQFSYSGNYLFWNNSSDLVNIVIKHRSYLKIEGR